MTTEELRANLTKTSDVIRETIKKLCDVSVDLPEDLEINVVRLRVAAATAHDVKETLVYICDLLTDEYDKECQLSSKELEKICAIICKHLCLVCELIGDILYDPAIDGSEYGTDLWVLNTAIAEMIGKFSQEDDNKEDDE